LGTNGGARGGEEGRALERGWELIPLSYRPAA